MLGIRTKNKIYCSYIEKLLSKFGSIQKIQLICNTIYNNRKMNTLVELSIKDFKAIKRADVQLDGITVVSGINGCGKSTMSKLLYYIFRNANSFEELVAVLLLFFRLLPGFYSAGNQEASFTLLLPSALT